MSPDGIRIRQLGQEDYDALREIWRRAGLHTIRARGRDSREAFARQLESKLQTALGLEVDGRLVAVVLTTHDGRKGWINRLAVDPAHRRKGHAARLVAAAEEVLRGQGLQVMAALVEEENQASLALFRRLGYTEIDPGIHYLSKRDTPEA